ncbi:hypothetical protein QVD17_29443 [Tagetes erecta]|uniref:CCHC-type domain-containing protein n=1 Tax=Tagetes erecta TaxID=13708 RepID=A0AAD8NT18_TARER|nr:hypothetical protein QVD17_29443 [Tagetes erecta]
MPNETSPSGSKDKEIIIHKETSSTTHFSCPILKPINYTVWAIRMKTILKANGLWDMIEPSPDTQTDEKKDMSATAYLFQALPEDMILQVASCKNAKEIWEALQKRHVGVDLVQKARLQTLKTEFEMLRMKEEDTIDSFTDKLSSIVTKVSGVGSTFDQPTLVRKLLSSVPKKFVQIVATIEQFIDIETTTLDEIIGRLKAFEERTNLLNKDLVDNQDKLLFTRQDKNNGQERRFGNRGQGRFNSSQENWRDKRFMHEERKEDGGDDSTSQNTYRNRNNNYDKGKKFTRDISKVKCYNCNRFGHYASDCPKPNQRKEESNLMLEDEEPTLLMAITEDKDDEENIFSDKEEENEKERNYWNALLEYFKDEEPEWSDILIERIHENQEVLTKRQDGDQVSLCDEEKECIEHVETSSKEALSPKNKVVKNTKTSHNKKKIEAVRDLQSRNKPVNVQKDFVQPKGEVAQRKNEDIGKTVRDQDQAHVTTNEVKDAGKQGKKPKINDKGLLQNALG